MDRQLLMCLCTHIHTWGIYCGGRLRIWVVRRNEEHRLWGQTAWTKVPALLLTCYVTSGCLLDLHTQKVGGQALVSHHTWHQPHHILLYSSTTPCWMQESLWCQLLPETCSSVISPQTQSQTEVHPDHLYFLCQPLFQTTNQMNYPKANYYGSL